jgi:hypothetical protein
MNIYIKYIILVFLLLLVFESYTQTFNDNVSPIITARFRKEQLKIKPYQTMFNVLVISNKNNKDEKVTISYEVPLGWNLIGKNDWEINIPAKDSVLLPIRASSSKNVKGEIGYSIIASVEDNDGRTLDNAYCFLKVPRISELRFESLSRISYFDQKTGKSELKFKLKNGGNIDEIVYLNFNSSNNLELKNEVDNKYSEDILVPAKSDTIIQYEVQLHQDNNGIARYLYRVDLKGRSESESFNSTFWFKHLKNYYRYSIPVSEKPLVVTVTGMNLFSEQDPRFEGSVMGSILFKNNRSFKYYFRQQKQYKRQNIFKNSRLLFEYSSRKLNVKAGDNVGFPIRFGSGRGGEITWKFANHYKIRGALNKSPFRDISNYGGELTYYKNGFEVSGSFGYGMNDFYNIDSKVGYVRSHIPIAKRHSVNLSAGLSSADHSFTDSSFNKKGYGYHINYYGEFGNNMRLYYKDSYGSQFYFGRLFGRHRRTGKFSFPLKNDYFANLSYYGYQYKPSIYIGDSIITERTSSFDILQFRLRKIISSDLILFGSPIMEVRKSNNLYNYNIGEPFRTHSGYLRLGVRSGRDLGSYFSPSVKMGFTWITDHRDSLENERLAEKNKKFFNARLNLNYHNPKWGFYLSYFYGPYSIGQQYSYFNSGFFSQTLRIMPYYEAYIYEDIIKFQTKISYLNSLANRTQRFNLLNKLTAELNYGITLDLLNTITYQVSTDVDSEEKYKYTNTYFEIRARKEFGWSQPRISYHDLKLNLFKDLNGNLRKDPNEPGVNNILVTIKRLDPSQIDTMDVDYEYSGPLDNNKLLSGQRGNVTYENITEGVYKISFANMGTTRSKFSADEPEVLVHVNKNRTLNIPYLEKNKIFGKIILNRSKLSNLGNVPVGNIKIKAKDSKGRVTSTLTNKNGEFTIFAPSVDKYVVSVNNIFQEHFNLRKNNYVVQLNGYKQFEVNFIFDEKRRKINFRPSFDTEDIEVQRVRRTNLSGTVKDENTLQPVRATIEIVDNTTGSTVETTKSDRNNGRFSTSFMTGSNYSMIVTAPGYWFYSEKLNLDQMLTFRMLKKTFFLKILLSAPNLN